MKQFYAAATGLLPPASLHRFQTASGNGYQPVFENMVGIKNSEANESVAFYKIWKNSVKFRKIWPKCI
jgi:hypothetical protein